MVFFIILFFASFYSSRVFICVAVLPPWIRVLFSNPLLVYCSQNMDPLSVLRDYATRNLLDDISIDGTLSY